MAMTMIANVNGYFFTDVSKVGGLGKNYNIQKI
jgi:hypothetical protein